MVAQRPRPRAISCRSVGRMSVKRRRGVRRARREHPGPRTGRLSVRIADILLTTDVVIGEIEEDNPEPAGAAGDELTAVER